MVSPGPEGGKRMDQTTAGLLPAWDVSENPSSVA